MTFSGTESLQQTDDAAHKLGTTATSSADVADSISSVAELIGCVDFAAKCLGEVADAVELCRSLEELLERKRDELVLSSMGMESTAASMAAVTEAMALDLQRSMADDVATDDQEYDDEKVAALVEQLAATDPSDQKSIDSLTAELQIELERKTGNYDDANLATELVKGGANVDDALAYASADEFSQSRLDTVWRASDPRALAEAIIPTLDLTNRQDLAIGVRLWPTLTGLPLADLEAAELLAYGQGPPSLAELGKLQEWLNDHEIGPGTNLAAYNLTQALSTGVQMNGERYLDELSDAAQAAINGDGDVDAAIEILMQYGTRDAAVGGVEFDETLLSVIGVTPAAAMGLYGALLQVQVENFDGVPDRTPLRTILNDAYIAQGLDPVTAALRADEAEVALTGFVTNFDMYRELSSVVSPPYEGEDWIDPSMITLYLTALTDDGGPIPELPSPGEEITMTEAEYARLVARHDLRFRAGFEGGIDNYLNRLRGDMEQVAAKSGLTLDELEAELRGIEEHKSEIFTFIGASKGSTDLLKMETAEDFLKLDEASQIKRSDIDGFLMALQGRSFLSTDDIDAIDSFSNGEEDGTLSIDDLVGWLPTSGLPIAVQDVLLASANSGSIDEGGVDRMLDWTGPISLALTAIGAATFPFFPPVGGAMMTAGGLLGGGAEVGAAIYQDRWGDVATEGFWLTLDLLDGPTQIAEIGAAMRARKLLQLRELYPDMMDDLETDFSDEYVDALISGASDGLDFSEYAAVVRSSGNMSKERAEALRLFGTDLKTKDGITFRLSDAGFAALQNGQGAEIERLVNNWKTLDDPNDAWQLYQWTTYDPNIKKPAFDRAIKAGQRFDPTSKKLKWPDKPQLDTSGWRLKGRLAEANFHKPGDDYEAHHIVAINALPAEPSRVLLREYGIDINDANNGAWLPRTPAAAKAAGQPAGVPHGDLHKERYYTRVNERLANAKDAAIKRFGADNKTAIKGALELELNDIRDDLLAGRAP